MAVPSWQSPPEGRARRAVTDPLCRLEDDRRLDAPARALAATAAAVLRSPNVRDGLRGTWFGHALHPVLTDFPLGAWLSASLLDFVGGRAAAGASRRLIGFGLLMTVPTAAAGLAEWQAADQRARRVGVVHAGLNGVTGLLYFCSWRARHRGRQGVGVALAVTGGVVANASSYLGGHLSLVRKVGTADPAFAAATAAATPEV